MNIFQRPENAYVTTLNPRRKKQSAERGVKDVLNMVNQLMLSLINKTLSPLMEKRHKFDHHFTKGVAPAEVIMELLNRDGFISDEQMQKWEEMSLEKKLQYAAKMQ